MNVNSEHLYHKKQFAQHHNLLLHNSLFSAYIYLIIAINGFKNNASMLKMPILSHSAEKNASTQGRVRVLGLGGSS